MNLPGWVVDQAGYSQAINVKDLSTSVTFSATGTLPPGLTLDPSGVLSGTPTATGTYHFTITVTNGFGDTASQDYTVTINPGPLSQYLLTGPSTVSGVGIAPSGRRWQSGSFYEGGRSLHRMTTENGGTGAVCGG
jgi:Putative Ig domain